MQIFAQKDVVFESIETESGVGGTHIKSMANILDIPVDLVRQSIKHFHAKKCHGTIKDIWIQQVPSSHKTAGNFTYDAGANGVYFAPKIQAENSDICSGNNTKFMPITSSHSCEANLQGKKSGMFGSKTKTFSSCSGNAETIGTNFAIRGQLKVDSKKDLELHHPLSTALHNEFLADGEVSILHGRKSSYFSESSSSRDAMWSKSSSTSSSSEQYIAPQFSGSISIKAKSARIEVISGRILDFLDQIKEQPDDLTYVTLYEQYQYHHESHESPGPGLIALIALATAIATQGTSSAWAASAIKAASASVTMSVGTAATVHAAVTAGFQALMVKATTSMAANNFDVGKAVKDLASSSTLKELAIKMISAGAMQHVAGKLDVPTKASLQSQAAVSEQALNVSAEINMGQRVINQVLKAGVDSGLHAVVENKDFDEVLGEAVKTAAIATATGSITDKIDASFADGSMNTATHTASHMLTSVASGIASNNHNGILVGAVEGLIAARLPEMFAGKDQKSEKSADDLSAQEKLDAKTIRRQENSLHWIKQADLFDNPWDLEINDSADIAQQFEEQQAQQSIMDRHGLDYPSKDPVRQPMWVEKVALKSLYYLASLTSGTAYADELPLTSSSAVTRPDGIFNIFKSAVDGDPNAQLEMRRRFPIGAAFSDATNSSYKAWNDPILGFKNNVHDRLGASWFLPGSMDDLGEVCLNSAMAMAGVSTVSKIAEGYRKVQFAYQVYKTTQSFRNRLPSDRIQHEAAKSLYRQNMEKPVIQSQDPSLRKVIDSLYRPDAKVGSGSTADGVRLEISNNQKVGGSWHVEKSQDTIKFLNDWLKNNPTASPSDRGGIENIIIDLKDALGKKPWYSQTKPPKP